VQARGPVGRGAHASETEVLMGELVLLADARGARTRADRPRKTKAEIAAHFGVSERTISRWMQRGMPFEKPFEGGSVRFLLVECDAWFRRRR